MQASVDEAVAQWCADHRVGVLDTISIWLADLSGALGVLALVAVIWICFAVWFGGWRPMLHVVLVLAAVSLLTEWMKPVIDRPRPSGDLALTEITGSAMPSSHAIITSAIVVAVVMADWWVSARLRRVALATASSDARSSAPPWSTWARTGSPTCWWAGPSASAWRAMKLRQLSMA